MKYFVLYIITRDGAREYLSKVVRATKCKNIQFAAQWYTAHFYDDGIREFKDSWWWFCNGEIASKVYSVQKATKKEFKILNRFI